MWPSSCHVTILLSGSPLLLLSGGALWTGGADGEGRAQSRGAQLPETQCITAELTLGELCAGLYLGKRN